MKKILSLLIICFTQICHSQTRYNEDKTVCPNDTLCYLKYDMSLLNGIVYNEFGDVGLFTNGIKNGIHKKWYENGQLEFELNLKNGKKDGLYKWWYENGQLEFELNLKNGELDGLGKSWYKNGQLSVEGNYKNGKRDGLSRGWDKNGQLEYEGNWKDGKLIE